LSLFLAFGHLTQCGFTLLQQVKELARLLGVQSHNLLIDDLRCRLWRLGRRLRLSLLPATPLASRGQMNAVNLPGEVQPRLLPVAIGSKPVQVMDCFNPPN